MRLLILLITAACLLPAAEVSQRILDTAVGALEDAVAADRTHGAVVLVAKDGEVILHEAVGLRDKEAGLPMEKDTLFHMASNTKPVVAAAILMLAEEEKLSLDDRVRKYIPSFDNYRAGDIRIRHLLSHTSGLRIDSLFLKPMLSPTSLQKEAARFGEVGAEVEPGASYQYSNPGYNTLGAIIEIVSETPLKTFLKQRIYEPLGMKDSYNHEPDAPQERMGMVYKRRDGQWRIFQRPDGKPRYPFARASGGMISTAADYLRFCQLFLNGGELDGHRLLSEASVKTATTPFNLDIYTPKQKWSWHNFYGYGWTIERNGTYSHGGSEGTYAWVNPTTKVIGIFFTQGVSSAERNRFIKLVEAATNE
jgi:CubicO group peptidase (beta-lactamase class C family)